MAEASSQSNVPTLAEELGSIAARAQTYTGASGAAIALGEGSADEMICRACSGPAAPDIGASIRLEGTFTGMAVQSGQALRCDDSDTDKRVDAAACRALGTRSIVVVPIRDADTEVVSGVLAVFAGSKNAFNDLHVAVLRTMAREVAVAVQKARKQGVTLSTMSMPAYVEPAAPVRPSNPGFKPPVTSATPRPIPVPTPSPSAAAAPKPAPIADPAPTMTSPAPRPAAPPPPPPPAPAKLAPPVPPPPPKEDPLAPQPMAVPIKTAAKPAAPPAPEWKPAPPPPPRKVDTPAPFEAHKAATSAPVTFGTFDNVAADKKPGGGGMMIWIGVAAVAVLIVGGYFGYKAFSSGEGSQAKPQQQAAQSQPQQQAASTPAPAAASPTPAPAANTTSAPASQPAASQAASKPAATPTPAPQQQQQTAKPAAPPQQQPPAKPAPQPQQAVARTLSTPTPNASAPRQEDVRPLPMQAPQVAVPITTSAPTLAATKQSQSTQAQLISSVQPKYPEMARTMHAGGDVVMTAIIGKDGVVKSVKTISGHPLLRGAAENAVKQWRYKPATLNGEPVEATTQVTLKFAPQ